MTTRRTKRSRRKYHCPTRLLEPSSTSSNCIFLFRFPVLLNFFFFPCCILARSHDESHSEGEYDSDTGVTPSSATAPKVCLLCIASCSCQRSIQPPAAATDTDTVIKAGYLFKKGHVNKRWKKRWFVLRSSGQLCYYKTEEVFNSYFYFIFILSFFAGV